jgi:hypothetical protein
VVINVKHQRGGAVGIEPETPEEVALAWQAEHPEGEIIHVETDEEGHIQSIDEHPYDDDDDDD